MRAGTRAFTWIGLVFLLALVGTIGTTANHHSQEEAECARYRALMQEISNTIRSMPHRALAAHATVELQIDAKRGSFQLVTLVGKRKVVERAEERIWLPDGLYVLEAPTSVTALPTGRLSTTSIVIAAPGYNRLFRLSTRPPNMVQLYEEPLS